MLKATWYKGIPVSIFCKADRAQYNYHRPCYFPKTVTDSKGKAKDKKVYPYDCMMTPYDKLKSIDNAKNYLKPDITFEILDKVAFGQTDDEAAEQL